MQEQIMQQPIVAVRIILSNPQGQILLLKRANSEYATDQWCLPGGKMDYGDSPEQTVEKELQEETAITASNIQFLFYQNSLPLARGKMHCLNLYFSCVCSNEDVILNEESDDYCWLTPEEALQKEPCFGAVEAIRKWMQVA